MASPPGFLEVNTVPGPSAEPSGPRDRPQAAPPPRISLGSDIEVTAPHEERDPVTQSLEGFTAAFPNTAPSQPPPLSRTQQCASR